MYPVDQFAKSTNFRMRLFVKILDFILPFTYIRAFPFSFFVGIFFVPNYNYNFSQHLVENLVALKNSHRLIIAWFTFAKIFVLKNSKQPR